MARHRRGLLALAGLFAIVAVWVNVVAGVDPVVGPFPSTSAALGQKTMAGSASVVIASDQSALPISGTISLPAGAATETTLGTRLADTTFTGRINTQGQKTMATSTPVVLASDQSAVPVSGTVTTTPPSNASTNVTQFGGTNVSTGTGAGGAGIPRVTLSNDSSLAANQSVAQRQPTTGAVIADLAVTTTSQQLVASDATRLGITCTNMSTTDGIRWGPGSTPTATSGALLKPGASIADTGTYAVNVIRDTAATANPTITCSRSNT